MKILQIVPSVSLVYGGPSQMVLGLSKALADQGVELTLITTNSNGDTGQPPLDVPLEIPLDQDGYQIIYFHCSPFRRYKFSLPLLQWLIKHGKDYDLAHIHALFSPLSTLAATICRTTKLPYILRPLGTLDPADLQKKRMFKKIYGNLLEKPNLAQAAAVHFTSEQECKISERFGAKTQDIVVHLGVEFNHNLVEKRIIQEKLGMNQDKIWLLFLSRIDQKKGLDLLLPALENLIKEGFEFYFILAGANPQDQEYENNIKQKIKNSVLNEITIITGFVEGEMKLGLLQNADLFVLPSYYENFGIAVAEAIASQTPVVISDQVYIWEDIQQAQAGWVCHCAIGDLTAKLRLALQDQQERKRRGINAQKLAQNKYSWQAIARQLIQIYEEKSLQAFLNKKKSKT
jgi:glycosyltransferase involved in cell wall biosynthesis